MPIAYDTILAAHTLDETRTLSLLDQCSIALGVNNWGKGVQRFGMAQVENLRDLLDIKTKDGLTALYDDVEVEGSDSLMEGMSYYCGRDVGYTHALYELQVQKLRQEPDLTKLLKTLILPGVNAFVDLELNGLWVDKERMKKHDLILAARIAVLRAQLIEEHISPELVEQWQAHAIKTTKKGEPTKDFINNDNFIRDWLFSEAPRGLGQLAVNFTKKGQAQVDEETLKLYYDTNPALKTFSELKKAVKGRTFFASWLD